MDIILALSIAVRLLAFGWTLVLLRRLRDWRIGVFTAMFALMAIRQVLSFTKGPQGVPFFADFYHLSELPGLAVSVLSFLMALFLGRMVEEQRRAKEVLQDREARLKNACKAARMGICEWDIKTNKMQWSEEFVSALGIDSSQFEYSAQRWMEMVHPKDRPELERHMQEVSSGKSPRYDLDFCLELPTGEERYMRSHGEPILDPDGKPVRVISAVLDITERKRIELAIEYLAQGLSGTVDADHLLQKMVCYLAKALNVEYALIGKIPPGEGERVQTLVVYGNGQIRDNFQYNLAGTPCENVANQGFCIYLERIQELFPEDDLLVEMGATSYAGTPLHDADGRVIGLLATVGTRPFQNTEMVRSLLGVFGVRASNELERRRNEENLRMTQFALDRAADAVYWIRPDARFAYANDQAIRSLGYSREELLSMTVHDVDPNYPQEVWPSHWQEWARKKSMTFESTQRTKQGSEVPVEISVNFIEFQGKQYNCAFVRGIAERKQVEAALRQKNAFLHLLHRITAAANASAEVDQALQVAIDEVCNHTGWPVGHVYMSNQSGLGVMVPTRLWHLDEPERFETFRRVTESMSLDSGEGLPGRVLARGKPAWIVDVTRDDNFPRAQAAEDIGVRAGFAFPVLVGNEVAAVLEFYSPETQEPDEALMEILASVGTELGRAIERERAAQAIQESKRLLQSVTDNTLAVIYIKDLHGRYMSVNRRFEELFNVSGQQINGKTDYDIFSKEVADKFVANDRMVAERNCRIEFEEVALYPDTNELHTYISDKFPLYGAEGKVYAVCGISTDITQRKRDEEQLRLTRFVVDHAGDAVFTVSKDGHFIDVNETACVRMEYAREELLGMSVWDINPDYPQEAWPAVWERVAKNRQATFEVNHRTKSGRLIPVEIVARHIEYTGRECVCAFVRDVTERKATEDALMKSEERLQRIADTIPGAVYQYRLSPDGNENLVYVSQGVQKLFGYTAQELLEDIGLGWGVIDPGCVPAMRESIIRSAETMGPWNHVFKVIRKDGRDKWIQGESIPFRCQADGSTVWAGIFIDVTSLKRAEEELEKQTARFKAIFQGLPDSVVLVDTNRTIVMCNPSTLRVYGYKTEELLGQNSSIFYADEDDHHEIGKIYLNPDTTREPKPYRMRYKRKNGEIFFGETVAGVIRDSDGKPLGYIGMMRDITDRIRVEEEKSLLETELRHAQKLEAIGTLAGGIAHDFNNVITAIFGHTEIAKKSLAEGHPLLESLEMIERVARQGESVTRSLLTFAHKTPVEKTVVDLTELLQESVRILRRLLPASMNIIEDYSNGSKIWVHADAGQIQQIMMNLTVNARDAMEKSGGLLRISLRSEPDAKMGTAGGRRNGSRRWATLAVEDTGVGMNEEMRNRIFEPFFTTKARGAGTGLGLAVVHGIVTDHGGRIAVESSEGSGTRFIIRLPRCSGPAEVDFVTPRGHGSDTATGKSILVAEDNEFVRDIMVTSLRSAGYQIACASDGREAMEIFNTCQDHLSLAILDLDMPNSTGMSCMAEIHKKQPGFPVVIVTGNIDLFMKMRSETHAPILNKPFQMNKLVEFVRKSFEGLAGENG